MIPILASGPLLAKHRVHAAQAPKPAPAKRQAKKAKAGAQAGPAFVVTSLKELPPPDGLTPSAHADDPWQKFFAYALGQETGDGEPKPLQSAVLKPDPSLDEPERRECATPYPAVVIDLDNTSTPFVPEQLTSAPPAVAEGFARLRAAGIVVLWISQLPASRAADVAQALRTSGLDPRGLDQLLLIRAKDDRKQLLRDNASDDVCIVAIAGDERGDFDELFHYLRNPEGAVGLDPMMGNGWFLVPPLDGSTASAK